MTFPAALLAQTPAPAPPAEAPAPAPAPAPASRPDAKPEAPGQRVEITGGRQSDTDQRRQSTAAKIVIGREEIDKFGDATVGEVLRRLPGVTTPGAPGRGGPPRLRGLGNGFTQILIDGQRIPPGFSLESLTPEQVERIEILRAPTAETGARAIAGTINIITREGFKRRLNDLRLGFGYENGKLSPGLNWTHNDTAGDLTYNLSGSAFRNARKNSNRAITTVQNLDTGATSDDRTTASSTEEKRFGTNLTARLQWRLNESGDSLALMPSVFHTESHGDTRLALDKRIPVGPNTPLYDTGTSVNDARFTVGRLGLMWRQRLGPVRLEANGGLGSWRAINDTLRTEFVRGTAAPLTVTQDNARNRERSANLTLKNTLLVGGDPKTPGTEQTLVWGVEAETVNRTETRVTLQNGVNPFANFGGDLQASSLRLAAYGQDEWTINPNWSAYLGLRWEGITTKGDATGQLTGVGRPTNRSSVWTPLAQAVWKPDPKSRDQVRMALTRSYRSPQLNTLIARPSISRDFPIGTANNFSNPDTAGNPNLKPELATGIDIAFERYLENGGVLSANVFRRNISDLIRGSTQLETVSWSPGIQRYVRRQQNIGDAVTQGVELEAKFRLDQLITGAPGIELRSNFSVFDSKVQGVPGPNNRLDQQSKATANFGGDYRIRGTPFTLGGNVNWVPGYTTRLDAEQTVSVDSKQVWDAYALWTFTPTVALRLLGSNLNPRAYDTVNVSDVGLTAPTRNERTTVRSGGPSHVNWQLRLELKL
jgi:iron complex outermembrane receptor protein